MKNRSCTGFGIVILLFVVIGVGCSAKEQSAAHAGMNSSPVPDSTDYKIMGIRKTWNAILVAVAVNDAKKIEAVNNVIKKRFNKAEEDKDKTVRIYYYNTKAAALAESKRIPGSLDNQSEMDSLVAHRLAIYSFNPPKFEAWDFFEKKK